MVTLTVELKKGENANIGVELGKHGIDTLTSVTAGLGWKKRGTAGAAFDLDLSAYLLGSNGKIVSGTETNKFGHPTPAGFIFYNHLATEDGTVTHAGDNLTGENAPNDNDPDEVKDKKDKEQIHFKLNELSSEIDKIAVVVTIDEAETRKQNFGQVEGGFVRVFYLDPVTATETVLFSLDLTEDFPVETGLLAIELYRKDGDWKVKAVRQGYANGLVGSDERYGVV